MAKYLNDTGLSYLWGKLTTLFMKKSDYVTTGGTGKVLASVDSDKLGGVLPSGYVSKDVNGNALFAQKELKEAVLDKASPASPIAGQIWYQS